MENEMFTFVTCTHVGHSVEYRYLNRPEADRLYNTMVEREAASPEGEFVAYYCASVGGLVNSWRAK
jgi:hypothetical protein